MLASASSMKLESERSRFGNPQFKQIRKNSRLGLIHLTAIRLLHLSPAEKRALSIADNKLAELGEWDLDILPEELGFLLEFQNRTVI